jgi:aminoglycoside phosphotransferase (APT) family kinase protein
MDHKVLPEALRSVVAPGPPAASVTAVLGREVNSSSSTFESEIVTCRLSDGRDVRLLCKYERFRQSNQQDHASWGHRRGGGYEAEVYRRVLEPIGDAAPRFYGAHRDRSTGLACVLLEYVEGASHPEDAATLPATARWLARFHHAAEPLVSGTDAAFLSRYDRDYLAGWSRRTEEFAQPFREHRAWVACACQRFAEIGPPALLTQPTVIHGECYRKNLLIRDGRVYGIDWETCAVAAGEIDLAMLTEGWSEDDRIDEVVGQYAHQRWPEGIPSGFPARLALARVYVHLRWLGDHLEWTPFEAWRFDELRIASERAGLL